MQLLVKQGAWNWETSAGVEVGQKSRNLLQVPLIKRLEVHKLVICNSRLSARQKLAFFCISSSSWIWESVITLTQTYLMFVFFSTWSIFSPQIVGDIGDKYQVWTKAPLPRFLASIWSESSLLPFPCWETVSTDLSAPKNWSRTKLS